MLIHLENNGLTTHAELFKRKIAERIPVSYDATGLQIVLKTDAQLGSEESYEICPTRGGFQIIGSDQLGLLHGIGKFLHTAKWRETEFIPNPPRGLQSPATSFRAMYFSVHNYNWYHTASVEELEDYLEDMVLWGYNAIHCIVPVMNITTLGDDVFQLGVEKARRLFLLAKKLGMKASLGINVNQGLLGSPHEFDADQSLFPWHAGRNLCPAKPGAMEHLTAIWRAKFEQFTDIGLDFIHTWPYDEGGCSCEHCRPWGARGYADLCNACHEVALSYYPNAKFILSTWCFDDTGHGCLHEYEGFYERLRTDLSWADYIMVDSHTEYPRYVLTHPPVKPVVNFPEISMWGLYPWGGFGATVLPNRFQEIWDSSKRILAGGMPYSEGIYEDISKIQWAGYYWEPDRSWRDILSEYINYEYTDRLIPQVLQILELIEKNHVAGDDGTPIDLGAAHHARQLAEEVNDLLPDRVKTAWRWRILYIRTLLDVKRYEFYCIRHMSGVEDRWTLRRRSGKFLEHDKEAQCLMHELCELYHCVDYNGQNRWTHPPTNGGDMKDTLKIALKEIDG